MNSKIFWFGDLNYRINMSDAEVRKLVDRKQWAVLLNHDQVCKPVINHLNNRLYIAFATVITVRAC